MSICRKNRNIFLPPCPQQRERNAVVSRSILLIGFFASSLLSPFSNDSPPSPLSSCFDSARLFFGSSLLLLPRLFRNSPRGNEYIHTYRYISQQSKNRVGRRQRAWNWNVGVFSPIVGQPTEKKERGGKRKHSPRVESRRKTRFFKTQTHRQA